MNAPTGSPQCDPPKPSAVDGAVPVIRAARVDDAAAVWELVRDSGALDLNSPYAYLLAFHHHGETSVVATDGGRVVGFVLAYRPPADPDAVFVWQVGVAPTHRRQGLGQRLLHGVLAAAGSRGARFVEATVTPSNDPSLRLFASLADDLEAVMEVRPCFTADQFPAGETHEPEHLIRIGPISRPG